MFLNLFLKEKEWNDFFISKKKNIIAEENTWSYLLAGLFKTLDKPMLVITPTPDKNIELLEDFDCIDEAKDYFDFPFADEGTFFRNRPADIEKVSQRVSIIKRILDFKDKKKPFAVIASVASIISRISLNNLENFSFFQLNRGMDYKREEILKEIANRGYERVGKVFDKGEFAVRGDIIDIFDLSDKNPVRLDFFDTKLERISHFDIKDYSVLDKRESYSISPNKNPWKIDSNINDTGNGSLQKYFSLPDLFKEFIGNFNLVICEPLEIYLKLKSELDLLEKMLNIKKDELLSENVELVKETLVPGDIFENDFLKDRYTLSSGSSAAIAENYFEFKKIKSQSQNFSNPGAFLQNLKTDIKKRKKIFISLSSKERLKRITELFSENNLAFETVTVLEKASENRKILSLTEKDLLRGFKSENSSLYGELDIYEQLDKKDNGIHAHARGFNQFNPGDFVVHKAHGIGRYVNIVSEIENEVKKDYFLIEYARGDKLYVPTWQAERIHKYIGDSEPVVTTLNSRQWDNLKTKVRKSVKTLALDLAKLYAERQSAEGISFPPDSPWQKEIEDLFPFNETKDQLEAINKIKQKMQEPKPMDVLLCGDVGFGKTEVAIRAAFKAAENGRQVLMLVPTTILADQHFNTFKTRFKDYPVIVDVVSRFKKKALQKEIIGKFNAGSIDILIGTHRILADDIKPRDLGLIIIDEEQRFGVNAKEKLKLLKKQADVLTLTATPIPRTLYMSLTGIKDIVLIETYPENRHPIKTFVGRKNKAIIKNAVEREIQRGGQIYYVSNRVLGIERLAYELKMLVPAARIAITHGRLKGSEIERLMEEFINKKYDILLTTSIIESGMDIANVNTLIVENAQRFGLAQLYQLRGRVGRSSERAYAYFFYTERDSLTFNALERLKALEEFNALGSGYNIALKDLEIRGAGELLGANQHGHMSSVGFDLYCEIIREEIEMLKGNEPEKENNVLIDLPVSAYIPKSFIKNENDRINLYKSLSAVADVKDIEALLNKVIERSGKLPAVLENLFNISKIKLLLKGKSIEKLKYVSQRGIIISPVSIGRERALKLNKKNKNINYNFKDKSIIISSSEFNSDISRLLKILENIIEYI